jgi:hypothetical protein
MPLVEPVTMAFRVFRDMAWLRNVARMRGKLGGKLGVGSFYTGIWETRQKQDGFAHGSPYAGLCDILHS